MEKQVTFQLFSGSSVGSQSKPYVEFFRVEDNNSLTFLFTLTLPVGTLFMVDIKTDKVSSDYEKSKVKTEINPLILETSAKIVEKFSAY